jgi:peptidoglycan glycosyltransferase
VRRRITGLTLIVLVLLATVLVQAVYVQLYRAPALNADPANPRNQQSATQFPRGDITSAEGTVLAVSVPSKTPGYPWKRIYPLGSLTASVVGYNSDYYGTAGIEYQYDHYLVSHPQPAQSISQLLSPVRSTDNVNLTLEVALQRVAEQALGGKDGAVVAIDPRTGAVLSMYSNPTYDPAPLASPVTAVQQAAWARYTRNNAEGFPPLGNLAIQQTFPPGSTFKVVTTAAVYRFDPALQYKSYPSTVCIPLPESNKKLCNDGLTACGGTIAIMLPVSCDPGYAQVGMDLGGTTLYNQATLFGYNAIPPLDLPGVVPSSFPTPTELLPQNLGPPGVAYSAIGQQNVRATALQDALVAAGIADGGRVMAPHLLNTVTDQNDQIISSWKPSVWRHPLSASQAAQVVPLMQNVVKYGTASGVGFLYQDDVAAKTGTAQTGNAVQNTDDWMIAFAPATDPVVAVGVVVPFQANYDYGATVAGPIVKCVIEAQLAIDAHEPPTGTATTCPS